MGFAGLGKSLHNHVLQMPPQIALVFALIFVAGMAWADDSDASPKPPPFRPWQDVWQCNDVRVTVTSRSPEEIEYDLGGMIWGGSRFTVVRGNLQFGGYLRNPSVTSALEFA